MALTARQQYLENLKQALKSGAIGRREFKQLRNDAGLNPAQQRPSLTSRQFGQYIDATRQEPSITYLDDRGRVVGIESQARGQSIEVGVPDTRNFSAELPEVLRQETKVIRTEQPAPVNNITVSPGNGAIPQDRLDRKLFTRTISRGKTQDAVKTVNEQLTFEQEKRDFQNKGLFGRLFGNQPLPAGTKATVPLAAFSTSPQAAANVVSFTRRVRDVTGLNRINNAIQSTRAARTISSIPGGKAAVDVTTAVGESIAIDRIYRGLENRLNPRFQRQQFNEDIGIFTTSSEAANQARPQQKIGIFTVPTLRGAVSEVLPFYSTIQEVSAFRSTAADEFRKAGVPESEIPARVDNLLLGRNIRRRGATAGLLALNTATEGLGQKFLSRDLAKNAAVLPKKGIGRIFTVGGRAGKNIFGAGVVEGATEEILTQTADNQKLNFARIGISGAAGGAFAAGLGGAIAGLGASSSTIGKTAGKGLQITSYTIDPFEIWGDIADRTISRAVGRATGRGVITPAIVPQVSTDIFTVGRERKGNLEIEVPRRRSTFEVLGINDITPQGGERSKVMTGLGIPVMDFTPTSANTPVNTKSTTITPVPTGKTNTNIFNNIFNPVNIPDTTNNINPFPVNPNTNINIFGDTVTPVNIITDTPTNTPTNVNTLTPLFKFPPPILPTFDLSGGVGRGGGRRVAKQYKNELDKSLKSFRQLTGLRV